MLFPCRKAVEMSAENVGQPNMVTTTRMQFLARRLRVGDSVCRAPDRASGSRNPCVMSLALALGVPSLCLPHLRMKWARRVLPGGLLVASSTSHTSFWKNEASSACLAFMKARRSSRLRCFSLICSFLALVLGIGLWLLLVVLAWWALWLLSVVL